LKTTIRISNMKIIDSHAHLCDSIFDGDREAVLSRAQDVGVHAIIAVGENHKDALRNLDLAQEYSVLKPTLGLYPEHLDLNECQQVCSLIEQCQNQIVGIGEVGLDYWIAKTNEDRAIQHQVFRQFIQLSIKLDLPLNVHSRSAGRHAIAILVEEGAQKVQMHAFDGKASSALPAVEAGYYFSIPPSIVRSKQKQKLVRQLPLECLLIETDSPVLGATPNERNEPANVIIAIDKIAKIKGVHREKVIEATYDNTLGLYGEDFITAH
jgi:TatD DNase family protein